MSLERDRSERTPVDREREPGVVSFRQLLIDTALSDNLAVPETIRGLDLNEGRFNQDAERLLDESIRDTNGHERGIEVYVTSDKKVLVRNKSLIGFNHSAGKGVEIMVNISTVNNHLQLPRRHRQDRYLASIIHSHGVHDLPPSFPDLQGLFFSPDSIRALPIIFVITTGRKILVARTAKTPHLTEQQLMEKNYRWIAYIEHQFRSQMKWFMRREERRELENKIQTGVLRGIVKDNHLMLFCGDSTDEIVYRVDI